MKQAEAALKQSKSWKDLLTKYFGIVAIVILFIAFVLMEPSFANEANLKNLFSDSAPLMVMAAGMTFVLLLGSIDLSVGAACSVANVIVVDAMIAIFEVTGNVVVSALLAALVAVGFGIGSGLLLGWVHVRFKVPSFIASLGFMSVWKSVALLLKETPISIPKALWGGVEWAKISFGVIGLPLLLAVALIIVFFILQTRTPFGKYLMAIGGNERAARVSGIPVNSTKIKAFMLTGMCSAFGGIFLAAKLRSSAPTVGDSFTLLTISAVVLGGTSLSGGKGSILGTVIGVFVTTIIRNGMNVIGVDVFWQNIVFGLVVLGAVALTVDRKGRNIIVK